MIETIVTILTIVYLIFAICSLGKVKSNAPQLQQASQLLQQSSVILQDLADTCGEGVKLVESMKGDYPKSFIIESGQYGQYANLMNPKPKPALPKKKENEENLPIRNIDFNE